MNIEFLSPSSIMQWQQDRDQFVLDRVVAKRPPKQLQTLPMAIGSAFDCLVKNYLQVRLTKKRPDFDFQIENPDVEDEAIAIGTQIFGLYLECGAMTSLISEIGGALMMEDTVRGIIQGVPILGKPDLWSNDFLVDWKVNGAVAKSMTSPKKGYTLLIDVFNDKMTTYKDKTVVDDFIENIDYRWALQLAIYSWLCGASANQEVKVGIEQICGPVERLRIARHRHKISVPFQQELIKTIVEIWERIQSEHYFDLPLKESQERVEMLEQQHKIYESSELLRLHKLADPTAHIFRG